MGGLAIFRKDDVGAHREAGYRVKQWPALDGEVPVSNFFNRTIRPTVVFEADQRAAVHLPGNASERDFVTR